MDSSKETLRQNVASDVYKGYELAAVNKLYRRLPKGDCPFEDALSEMRLYALEAVELYSESHAQKASFTTFLYKHLQVRSYQWFNYSWLNKNMPKGKWVLSMSTFKDDINENEYDPTQFEENNSIQIQIKELLSKLTVRSKQLLEWMFDVSKDKELGPGLIEAFVSKQRVKAVRNYTGCSTEEVHALLLEVHKLAPRFVEGF